VGLCAVCSYDLRAKRKVSECGTVSGEEGVGHGSQAKAGSMGVGCTGRDGMELSEAKWEASDVAIYSAGPTELVGNTRPRGGFTAGCGGARCLYGDGIGHDCVREADSTKSARREASVVAASVWEAWRRTEEDAEEKEVGPEDVAEGRGSGRRARGGRT